ncbi:MAG: SUMF1/EgtB/PvdO family nonheme iron enzyme [Anaerolineales bacterium]
MDQATFGITRRLAVVWAQAEGRGGSWNNHQNNARVSDRNNNHPNNRNNNIGFRVVAFHKFAKSAG